MASKPDNLKQLTFKGLNATYKIPRAIVTQSIVLLVGLSLLSSSLLAEPANSRRFVGYPIELSSHTRTQDRHKSIILQGALALKGDLSLAETSGLAWDDDEQILYAVTDRGQLLHLRPQFRNNQLIDIELLNSMPLRGANAKPLKRQQRDAEGLAIVNGRNQIKGDSQLIVSFEHNHRIERYSTNGQRLKRLPLPKQLNRYLGKIQANRGLEAITLHPQLGLMTGTERPFKDGPNYLFNSAGLSWKYNPMEPKGSLVALEALPDGSLLILERAYISLFEPWIISLGLINQNQLMTQQKLTLRLLARFDSSAGWFTQNFEGLTQHQGNHFFIISDDGNKPWAQTQLLYFELIDTDTGPD